MVCRPPRSICGPKSSARSARLDLRAKFIVEGFLAGLHASPFQGFSVEFSEHRKYVPGDDLKDLDWNVFAKTDKYYLKKFQAETNVTGYLVDGPVSASMAYTYRQELTKFEYAICLAAALGYLMIHQQDPVGLVDVRHAHPGQPAAAQQADAARHHPGGAGQPQADRRRPTSPPACTSSPPMIRGKSLVMLFSDLLTDPEPVLQSLHHLRHRGHEVILFHILDEAEVHFPFEGLVEFEDVETPDRLTLDAQRHARATTCRRWPSSRSTYRTRVRQGEHRLCADGHERQLRQGADGVPAAAAAAVLV